VIFLGPPKNNYLKVNYASLEGAKSIKKLRVFLMIYKNKELPLR
jgi:hypothetical protein